MADLTINPDEIRDALKSFASSYDPGKLDHRGGVRHGRRRRYCHVEGLPGVMANELVKFADGTLGLAQNLDENEIGVVILGEFSGVEAGMEVTRTGEVLSVPVGDGYLGRVVDPLGNPIDGLGEIQGRRSSCPGASSTPV
jgi:F-type H+/Na+-transporting ATPase subunit alpha